MLLALAVHRRPDRRDPRPASARRTLRAPHPRHDHDPARGRHRARLPRRSSSSSSASPSPSTPARSRRPASIPPRPRRRTSSFPTGGSAPLEIDATAQQWLWRYEYPGGAFSYHELVVPVDTAVVLHLDSTDLIHRWWVPALGGAFDAVPGSENQTWFRADETGTYEGRSTAFSGPGYDAMTAKVTVLEPTEYEAWVAEQAADIQAAQDAVQEAVDAGTAPGVSVGEDTSEPLPGRRRRMTPPAHSAVARPEVVSENLLPAQPPLVRQRHSAPTTRSVGRMYIATALIFLSAAVTMLALMRLQLLLPDSSLMRPVIFDRLLSTYGVTPMLLFAVPLLLGLISYVVPLQIGARGVALPRIELALLLALPRRRRDDLRELPLPPLGGRHDRPDAALRRPLQRREQRRRRLGRGRRAPVSVGFVLFAINMITTVRAYRAPGMVWRRVPLFSFAATVISYVLLVVAPIMVADGDDAARRPQLRRRLLRARRGRLAAALRAPRLDLLHRHLRGRPARRVRRDLGDLLRRSRASPQFAQRTIAGSMAAFAVLGVLAWMQNMYSAPIPIGLLYFAMALAAGGDRPRRADPLQLDRHAARRRRPRCGPRCGSRPARSC